MEKLTLFHFFLQTSPWRSSCGACRRSVPARCVWIKKSTSSLSHVDTWWCAKSVRLPCESAQFAEAWLKAQFEPSSHNQGGCETRSVTHMCHNNVTECKQYDINLYLLERAGSLCIFFFPQICRFTPLLIERDIKDVKFLHHLSR